jgi:DNA invertase Pin-like site-specific DNA recombinase
VRKRTALGRSRGWKGASKISRVWAYNPGLQRAKAEGATFGRPATLDASQVAAVRTALATGASVSALARQFETSRQTIMRARDASAA